jgi:protein-S-isoprenylcysteine O-methyltransferase Ste14
MRLSTKAKTFMQLLLVSVGLTVVFIQLHPVPLTFLNIAGLILMIFGMVLWVSARLQLGDSFSVSAQARELISHGLYSKIRNPIYVFGTITISGFALAVGKPIYLLFLLLIVPLQFTRASSESKVLEDKFGDAYREYRRKTWF